MKYLCIAILLAAATLPANARGQRASNHYDFCAVKLDVVFADDNEPVAAAVAKLISPTGRVIQTQKVIDGRAEFCDFGFGDHSILVHDERSECASTEIRKVHVIYGFTQEFKVTLNSCVDEGDLLPGTACLTYIRVTSSDGKALKAVKIKYDGFDATELTDTYGRAKVGVLQGRSQSFTFTKPGYKSQRLSLRCGRMLEGRKKVSIVLVAKDGTKGR